jgi:hypothetical protein
VDGPAPAPDQPGAPTCGRCGEQADVPAPPTWSLERGERGPLWLCATCTRENLRAIEARLGEAWW